MDVIDGIKSKLDERNESIAILDAIAVINNKLDEHRAPAKLGSVSQTPDVSSKWIHVVKKKKMYTVKLVKKTVVANCK